MVGLYHKRRAERSQSKVLRCIIRAGAAAGVFTVVGFSLVAIFFNGTAIKGPLGSYLSSKTGLDVTIEDAEFSPVYPDVIKLNNVTFGSSKVGELYLEYDIASALSDDELKINDIYINDLKLSKEDLEAISSSKAGYKSIRANAVRFHHTPINTRFLKTKDATIRLNQVSFNDKDGLTFRSGSLAAEKLGLFNEQAKSFAVDFEQAPEGMRLNNFSVQMYGGIISGKGTYSQRLAAAATTDAATSAAAAAAGDAAKPAKDADAKDEKGDTKVAKAKDAAASKDAQAADAAQQIFTDIKLDELNLANVIIYSGLTSPQNITLTSESTTLSDAIFTDDAPSGRNKNKASKSAIKGADALAAAKAAEDEANKNAKTTASKDAKATPQDEVRLGSYIMQGINGSIEDLKITSEGMQGSFSGSADEISLPNLQTTMESNELEASFAKGKLSFKLQGSVYEGRYLAQGELDHTSKEFNLEKLLLKKAKLAINTPRYKFLSAGLSDYTFNLKHAGFEGLEFLSYLNALPMSIQSITGTMDNVSIKGQSEQKDQDNFYRLLSSVNVLKDGVFPEAKAEDTDKTKSSADADKTQAKNKIDGAAMELEFKNFLYSDLLISRMHSKWSLDEDRLLVEVPDAKFKESSAAAEALIARKAFEKSHLKVNAPDFESADLNSNLINHMLTGKVDFNLALESKAQAKTFESLANEAKGRMILNSDAMLISDLGLDLINGGKDKVYNLSYTELLNGVQGSVAGISKLKSTTVFNNGVAKNTTSMGLSTANMSTSFSADYERNSISGASTFISPAKDSSTRVTISGDLDDPRFKITPLRRGAQRPGLYLPQYDDTAKAKQQTDAAAVLNGRVQIEEPSKAPPPDTFSETSADAKDPNDASQDEATKPEADKTDSAADASDSQKKDKDDATAKDTDAAADSKDTTDDDPNAKAADSKESPDSDKAKDVASTSDAVSPEAPEPSSTGDPATSSDEQQVASSPTTNENNKDSTTYSSAGDKSSQESPNPDSPPSDSQAPTSDSEAAATNAVPDATAPAGDPTESLSTTPAATSSDKEQATNPDSQEPTTSPASNDDAEDATTSTSEAEQPEQASTEKANTTEATPASKPADAAVTSADDQKEDATDTAQDEKTSEPVAQDKTEATSETAEPTEQDAAQKDEAKDAAEERTATPSAEESAVDAPITKEDKAEADKTETDLLKDVLIDSFFDTEGDDEELIF